TDERHVARQLEDAARRAPLDDLELDHRPPETERAAASRRRRKARRTPPPESLTPSLPLACLEPVDDDLEGAHHRDALLVARLLSLVVHVLELLLERRIALRRLVQEDEAHDAADGAVLDGRQHLGELHLDRIVAEQA